MSTQVLDSIPLSMLSPVPVEHAGQTWPIYRVDAGEPRILDTDWAVKLGFAQPRMIRKLIKRLDESHSLGEVVRATVSQTSLGGRPGVCYLLTKAQALKVAARSETKYADSLLDAMIAVFLKVVAGDVVPAAPQTSTALSVPKNPIAALDMVRDILTGTLADIRTAVEGQQSTIDVLSGKVAEIDQRTQPKAKIERATPQAPAKREDAVMAAFTKLFPDISTKRLAEEVGCSQGQIAYSLADMKAKGLIGQTGSCRAPEWVLLDRPKQPLTLVPNPPAPPINPNFPPKEEEQTEMALGPTSREMLVKHLRAHSIQSGKTHSDCWSELYKWMEYDGKRCQNRVLHGRPIPALDYMELQGWCERALSRAKTMFPVRPNDRPSDNVAHQGAH